MRLRTLVPVLASCCLWAADGADAPPIAEIRLADGAVILDHLAASPLGRAWADPACAPLHRRLDRLLADAEEDLGIDPLALLQALRGTGMAVMGAGSDGVAPGVVAAADVGDAAETLIALAEERLDGAAAITLADADQAFADGPVTAVRWGARLGLFFNLPVVPPAAPATAIADLHAILRLDGCERALLAALQTHGGDTEAAASVTRTFAQMREHGMTTATYRLDIQADGVRERVEVDSAWNPGLLPVDRAVLARLPGTTLMVAGMGFDGAAYWQAAGEQFAAGKELNGAAAIDALLQEAGVHAGLGELVSSLHGTVLVAITQGVPIPGFTLALPRSGAIDQAVQAGLAKAGTEAPAEGASILVPLPERVPVALTLVRSQGYWLLTTDTALAMTWPAGQPGGWLDTPAARLALAQAPASSHLLGASDTPAVLRTIAGYLGMAMAFAKDADAETRAELQSGLTLLQRLAMESGTGYVYGAAQDGHTVTEGRGVLGLGGGYVIVGGLVAGALALQRHAEAAATAEADQPPPEPVGGAALLRSAIFPAEMQFQAGGYVDQDHDGTGEFAFLGELGGVVPVGGRSLALIDRTLASDEHAEWAVAIFLPDGEGGVASGDDDGAPRQGSPAAADLQERRFVAYAWPRHSRKGMMLAITEAGTLYAAPYEGEEPGFDSLFGGQGWDSAPVWEPYTPAPKAPAPAADHAGQPLM